MGHFSITQFMEQCQHRRDSCQVIGAKDGGSIAAENPVIAKKNMFAPARLDGVQVCGEQQGGLVLPECDFLTGWVSGIRQILESPIGRHSAEQISGRATDTAGCIVFCNIKSQGCEFSLDRIGHSALLQRWRVQRCQVQEQFDQALFIDHGRLPVFIKNHWRAEGQGNLAGARPHT